MAPPELSELLLSNVNASAIICRLVSVKIAPPAPLLDWLPVNVYSAVVLSVIILSEYIAPPPFSAVLSLNSDVSPDKCKVLVFS